MAVIQPTPDNVLDKATIEQLKRVNTTAVVDVLARTGYEPHYVYMPNVKTMNPGERLVARAITVRFVPARPDGMAEKPGAEESPEFPKATATFLNKPLRLVLLKGLVLNRFRNDSSSIRIRSISWRDLPRSRNASSSVLTAKEFHGQTIWQSSQPYIWLLIAFLNSKGITPFNSMDKYEIHFLESRT